MSIKTADLITAAKAIAQDHGADDAVGVKLLLASGNYDQAVDQALAVISRDLPNIRVYDYTVAAQGFLFALSGDDAILPTSGLDAWVEGGSLLNAVWYPYSAASQGSEPLDANTWRLRNLPGGVTGLEFLGVRPVADAVVRLEYAVPHILSVDDAADSSPRPGDLKALKILTASLVLTLAANKMLQNTGNTGLPSDVVDRRTQADVARSLAKDLRQQYMGLVGKGDSESTGAASGFLDLDVEPSSGRGSLWHPSWRR